jgi:hypothetical protein
MPTIHVGFRWHFGRPSLDHGNGIDRAADVRKLCNLICWYSMSALRTTGRAPAAA